jgi:hypothetical protein
LSTTKPLSAAALVVGSSGNKTNSDTRDIIREWSSPSAPPPPNDLAFLQQKTSMAFAHAYFITLLAKVNKHNGNMLPRLA